jgi:hypothetical protein
MPDFSEDPNQQDPEAARKALLARLFGLSVPAPQQIPLAPPGQATPQPIPNAAAGAPPKMTPLSEGGGDTNQSGAQSGPQLARPINGVRSPAAAPGGMTRSASISDPEATNASSHPLPSVSPILSESDWSKANPAPAHTPYQEPKLWQRLLLGLSAASSEFGRPGSGAAIVRDYLGNIERNEEAEKNYPETSAALQHQRYMTYVQGAEAPLHIQQLQQQISDTEAQARLRNEQALRDANPVPKAVKPENLAQMHAEALQDAIARGVKPSEDPKVLAIEDAIQRVQKEPTAKTPNDFESFYTKWLKDNNQADTAANQLKAHKEWEIRPDQPGANDARNDRSYQYNNNIIEKQRAPIDQRLERLDRAEQAVNQKSAQADALIAPELLSVMVGGQGSGLRMNEAEISRIVGGRSKWADLQAILQKWTPGSGLSVTPEQRQQISALLKVVREKTVAKQHAYVEAQTALSEASSVQEHRKITTDLKKKLSAIDSGPEHDQPAGEAPGKTSANPSNPAGI